MNITVGMKFGQLTVLEKASQTGARSPLWRCVCDCKTEKTIAAGHLKKGDTRSCGCLKKRIISAGTKRTHGMTDSPEYNIWCGIKTRCNNQNNPAYRWYGARGITVCDRWMESFENFLADMGRRPTARHSVDRIENNLGYSADNCRWANPLEQAQNKRRGTKLTLEAITEIKVHLGNGRPRTKIAEEFGVPWAVVSGIALGKTWKSDVS